MSFGPYAYFNNGLSFRSVAPDYVAQAGEVLFNDIPSSAELASAFPGYTAAISVQNAVNSANGLLAEGIAITSTGTSSLNGTYSSSQNTLLDLTGVMAYTEAKSQFPGGASSFTWYDIVGAGHTFTSVAQFQSFAEAICGYVAQILEYAASGGAVGSLPSSNSITIP